MNSASPVCGPATRLWPGSGCGPTRVTLSGESAYKVEQALGVERYFAALREELRSGTFGPPAVARHRALRVP